MGFLVGQSWEAAALRSSRWLAGVGWGVRAPCTAGEGRGISPVCCWFAGDLDGAKPVLLPWAGTETKASPSSLLATVTSAPLARAPGVGGSAHSCQIGIFTHQKFTSARCSGARL